MSGNRWLVVWGLAVYVLILATSFLHTWESYLPFSGSADQPLVDPKWEALGVALGLDMAIIYFSFIGVLRRSRTAKSASVTAMLLVWFAVLVSMLRLPESLTPLLGGDYTHLPTLLVGFALSLFVPLSSLRVGQVLGELAADRVSEERPSRLALIREALAERLSEALLSRLRKRPPVSVPSADTYLPTDEVARQAGLTRETLVRDWRTGKLAEVKLKRGGGEEWRWSLEDVLNHYRKEADEPATLRDDNRPPGATSAA